MYRTRAVWTIFQVSTQSALIRPPSNHLPFQNCFPEFYSTLPERLRWCTRFLPSFLDSQQPCGVGWAEGSCPGPSSLRKLHGHKFDTHNPHPLLSLGDVWNLSCTARAGLASSGGPDFKQHRPNTPKPIRIPTSFLARALQRPQTCPKACSGGVRMAPLSAVRIRWLRISTGSVPSRPPSPQPAGAPPPPDEKVRRSAPLFIARPQQFIRAIIYSSSALR